MLEGDVAVWLGGGLPPHAAGYLSDFTTRYMDPTEVYQRFVALANEFPNIAEIVPLPNLTNGYQRKAQANMAGSRLCPAASAATHSAARWSGRPHVPRLGARGR